MRFALLLATLLAAGEDAYSKSQILPAENLAHTMMITQVYLNGHGPFRMIVDTGAGSSTLAPGAAGRIGARAQYRVERLTASGVDTVAAGPVTVAVGDVVEEGIEMLFSPIGQSGADGVLGQNWLDRYSYLLDFRNRQVILNAAPPPSGLRLALREREGRPCVAATVDGVRQDLVIDSGASTLVLFRRGSRGARQATLTTNAGSAMAVQGRALVSIGDRFRRVFESAELASSSGAGLLPASSFQAVYVSKQSGLVVLVPR